VVLMHGKRCNTCSCDAAKSAAPAVSNIAWGDTVTGTA
jgi:hypothetical protein